MSKLYIVPTPIGNLEDMSFRAVRILKEVDLILAEDTRVSSRLLNHYEINTRLQTHHKFNEHKTTAVIVDRISAGMSVALISDAGTPGISDPGFYLIRECIKYNIEIESLPGATAFVPALLNSGLPCDRFYFEGFLPQKKGKQTRINYLTSISSTIILYESPHRLVKTLGLLSEAFGPDRPASVSRELTKVFEETVRDTLSGLIDYFQDRKLKGEFVLIIGGKTT